ncbi:hypothetical protein DPMN_184668 [Dreissena polymorpha]|uniref:Uncharacterized protein n=1 Tax=Dreissena polymorpha TaxID=45954 RepID=A0A9D4DKH1_DREPO|nr:hypothetical protein DPMN_184668 [Dreissena polymorpha]
MTDKIRLKRTISCTSTVFMFCLYEVGNRRSAAPVSKCGGRLLIMSAATSSTMSSVERPPPDEALAWRWAESIVVAAIFHDPRPTIWWTDIRTDRRTYGRTDGHWAGAKNTVKTQS